MIDIKNKKTLEKCFAEDFASPIYTILADMYLIEGDLKRAKKVCEIGLEKSQNINDGKYILAKIELQEEKLIGAEKLLKEVVDKNPAHFNAIRLLIDTEIKLKRSSKTIQNYIMQLLKYLPNDIQCIRWLDMILKSNSISSQKPSIKKIEKKMDTSKNKKIEETYTVVNSMATFSMVQILKSQKHYNQALNVLGSLIKKGEDKDRVSKEELEIKVLIEKSKL
jgi:tetratricopeptide (TPR) repeat protein